MTHPDRPTLALDADDVVFLHREAWAVAATDYFGMTVAPDDYGPNWSTIFGVSEADVNRFKSYFFSEEVTADFGVIEGAGDGIQRLAERFKIVVVTARRSHLRNITLAMLDEIAPTRAVEKVICTTTGLSTAVSRTPKAVVCREIGAVAAVDDQLHNVRTIAQLGINVVTFGNYPHNQPELPDDHTLPRINSWQELTDYFCPED